MFSIQPNFFIRIHQTSSCTYHLDDVFLETDIISNKDEDFIRNCIYRQELLNTFGLEEFDEKIIDSSIKELYTFLKDTSIYPILSTFTQIISTNFPFIKEEDCFMILFSFDFFYATLECLKDYSKSGRITDKNYDTLNKIIYSSFP
jgi:hypothetical protein